MDDLPQIADTVRIPLTIPIHPYFFDHQVEGSAVLPAVEALQQIATSVKRFRPDIDISGMSHARFEKFLYIQADETQIPAFIDIETYKNGDITAKLLTKTKSKKISITRIKAHATATFHKDKLILATQPLDLSSALEGNCIEIPPAKIYCELVPFGPAYHNIQGPLYICENGAIAQTGTPSCYGGPEPFGSLGSPFPLDAAFHAACVWGQRYARTVAFPFGFEKRWIYIPTRPGETYYSHIVPIKTDHKLLIFDIWTYDHNGNIRESVCGMVMGDVSAGRMKPPQWLIDMGG